MASRGKKGNAKSKRKLNATGPNVQNPVGGTQFEISGQQREISGEHQGSSLQGGPVEFDGRALAVSFLKTHAGQQPVQERENPAVLWIGHAWQQVQHSVVRFEEAPSAPVHEWADAKTDAVPRKLLVDIFRGDDSGTEVSMDKVTEAAKAPVKWKTIEELMTICTRVSTYGRATRLKPTSMLNLAMVVFGPHPSVEAAMSANTITDMQSLNALLGSVYSHSDQVTRYLTTVTHPKHHDYEDIGTFMQRCLTAYVSVGWYVKLTDVVKGIIKALPLALWGNSAPSLKDALVPRR